MTVLIFILVLVVLIIGHELGHFLTAKALRMRVLEFGLGFPPKIFGKKFKEDGTEYTVNWIPFGGFVRIFGEDEKEATDPIAFPNRPKLHQALVLFAGPFANIVLAFLLSAAAFSVGTFALIDSPTEAQNAKDPHVLIVEVLPDSPADLAGIESGDRIVSIGTISGIMYPNSSEDVGNFIAAHDGELSFSLIRRGEELGVSVSPVSGLIKERPDQRAIGIASIYVGTVSYPLHEALWRGAVDTVQDFVLILVSVVGLIASAVTLSADVSQIAGPVGIATLTGDAAALGLGALLSFSALLSVNLAIINLLPFPALDGGRLLFLGVETVTRRRIPLNVAAAVNTAGFAILILLMLAVTIGDISRLFG